MFRGETDHDDDENKEEDEPEWVKNEREQFSLYRLETFKNQNDK